MTYANRRDAGDTLGRYLAGLAGRTDLLVLGLVRGGVPVAAAVAAVLRAPLDVLVVRKLGVPWAPEVAFGAIGTGGIAVHNAEIEAHVAAADAALITAREAEELTRRESAYRGARPPLRLAGKVAVIVDDGLATGATARAAIAVARKLDATQVVLAVPVAAAESARLVRREADLVVCPLVPPKFGAVSRFYRSFPQVTDHEVIALLGSTLAPPGPPDGCA